MFNIMNFLDNTKNIISIEDFILNEIIDHKTSDKLLQMQKGQAYYQCDNDILGKNRLRQGEVNSDKPNNKLIHAEYKNLVDEKVGYLLTNPYTLKCDTDAKYLDHVKELLGNKFQLTLTDLGFDASNYGISWLQVYIDENGKFKTMVIPSTEIIPLWHDRKHDQLDALIRYYNVTVYEGKQVKEVTKIQYWTKEKVDYYILKDNRVILDSEMYLNTNGEIKHYLSNKTKTYASWGRVPFIAFKNNRLELNDLKFIKSLVDGYDSTRSTAADFIEEFKNLIYVLKGYGGESLSDFIKDLNYYGAVNIPDPEDGCGVDTLNPKMDVDAARSHYEQLKRDIISSGQGVLKDMDKFGSAPSGIALKFLYAGLDMKCNNLEPYFKEGFENLLYFINVYLNEVITINYNNANNYVNIIFNRDIKINITESVDNCKNSMGIVSEKTILANHPWVDDVEQELLLLQEQQEKEINLFDTVPTVKNNTDPDGDE